MSPSLTVAGTWGENFSIPGASLTLTVDAAGNGNGTYAIEAGRAGAVQVSGTGRGTAVTLTIHYDYGLVRTFKAAVSDANHLTGAFDDNSGTVVLIRRQRSLPTNDLAVAWSRLLRPAQQVPRHVQGITPAWSRSI
jgi:hypothetical protein